MRGRVPAKGAAGRNEFEELRNSISSLRDELETRFELGSRVPRDADAPSFSGAAQSSRVSDLEVSGLDPMELFDRARRWMSRLRGETRSAEVDEFGLDPVQLERARPLLDFLFERWWRVQVSGTANLGGAGGERVLFVSNRSGILPYDGLMIAHAVERHHPEQRRPRFLVADWLATLPFLQSGLARIGGIRACPENAERLLRQGEGVVAFPEGQKGALKLFRDRYRLQRFGRGGFVSLAVRLRAKVIPVAVVGAEEAHPILLRPDLATRLLGIPFPVTPTFPHLGPLGLVPLPARWRIRFGEPVRFDRVESHRAEDPLYVSRAREQIRAKIQSLLDAEVHARESVWR